MTVIGGVDGGGKLGNQFVMNRARIDQAAKFCRSRVDWELVLPNLTRQVLEQLTERHADFRTTPIRALAALDNVRAAWETSPSVRSIFMFLI